LKTVLINSKGDQSQTGFIKAPADVLPIRVDFTALLGSIASFTATGGPAIDSSAEDAGVVTVVVSGGRGGQADDLVVTAKNGTETKAVVIRIKTSDYTEGGEDYEL
jgi:hypothetical protein